MTMRSSASLWTGLGIIALLGSLVGGFWVSGSPERVQAEKRDAERLNRIGQLFSEVRNNRPANGTLQPVLPATLEELRAISYSNFDIKRDPTTNALFPYKKMDVDTLVICADFEGDATNILGNRHYSYYAPYPFPQDIRYSVGKNCFQADYFNDAITITSTSTRL